MEERLRLLFQKYTLNTCSAEELEELFALIRESDHEPTLRELIAALYKGDDIDTSSLPVVDASGRLVFDMRTRPRKYNLRRLAVAAGIIIVLAASAFLWLSTGEAHSNKPALALSQSSTAIAENKYLLLPDSTQVWLNAGSTIDYPASFDPKKREVYLSGEAYFDVRHADRLPFIIHTGNVSTHVLGTAFNIKAYPGQQNITVSVSRGKVQVSRANDVIATLVQGQQVKVGTSKQQVVEQNVQASGVGAWQKGQLSYQDESFRDIISDLERLYDISIKLDDNIDGEMKISTTFRKEIGIEQALRLLCRLTDKSLVKTNTGYQVE